MSYEQKEVNYVGRIFYGNDELVELLLKNKAVSQETIDGWSEYLEDGELIANLLAPSDILISDFPELQRVDSVGATNEAFLGYVIETQFVSKETFDRKVVEAKNKWRAIFNEEVELECVTQYV